MLTTMYVILTTMYTILAMIDITLATTHTILATIYTILTTMAVQNQPMHLSKTHAPIYNIVNRHPPQVNSANTTQN